MAENDWTKSPQGTQTQAGLDAQNGFVRNVQNLPNEVQQTYINSHPGTKK